MKDVTFYKKDIRSFTWYALVRKAAQNYKEKFMKGFVEIILMV